MARRPLHVPDSHRSRRRLHRKHAPVAEAIGAGLGLPVRSIPPEEATTHLDGLATFAQLDSPTSGAITQASLGWTPREPGLLAEMAASGYFGPPIRTD